MAHHPSFPGNDKNFREDFPGFVHTKSEGPSPPICISHHGPDLTRNVRDTDIRFDDHNPDLDGVTAGTHGRNSSVDSGTAVVMATSGLGVDTILQGPSRLVAQFPPPLSSTQTCVTSTGVWDVKQETVTTPSPGHSSTSQVKQELRNLITARQPQPSTSKGHETQEGRRNPTHIQNVSYLLQTLKDVRRHFSMISASCIHNYIPTLFVYFQVSLFTSKPLSVSVLRSIAGNCSLISIYAFSYGLKFGFIQTKWKIASDPVSGNLKTLKSCANFAKTLNLFFHRAWTLNGRNVAVNRTDKQHNDVGNGNKTWPTVLTGYVKFEYTGIIFIDDNLNEYSISILVDI